MSERIWPGATHPKNGQHLPQLPRGAYQRTHQQQFVVVVVAVAVLQVARGINANYVCNMCAPLAACVWITRERGMFLAIFHFRGGKTTCQLSQVAVIAVAVGAAQVAQVARGHLEWVSCRPHVAVAVTVVPACCWTCCWARCGRCECGDKAPNVQQACAGSQ